MEKMNAQQRNSLPKSNFGLPGVRKYPMPDRAHAADAKSRAAQQENAGNLSAGDKAKIDAKADRILGKHGIHRVAYMADGDLVPGTPNKNAAPQNRDTQPVMAEPGEFVMPKDSVQKIGVGKLRAMKDATHTPVNPTQPGYGVVRMADGDIVPGPFDATKANFQASQDALGKAASSDSPVSQTIGASIGGVARTTGGVALDTGRDLVVNPIKSVGNFIGGVYRGTTDPGNAPATNAAPTPATTTPPTSAPRQAGGASGNFDTPADSQNAAPVAATQSGVVGGVPQDTVAKLQSNPSINVGADGQATNSSGNPIAGYGSFTSSDGKTTYLTPNSVGASQRSAPQIGINAAAYAPTQYSNSYGTMGLQDQAERAKAMLDATPNITNGLDLTSPQGVAALAARAAPVIMRNVATKQAAREEGFGVQRQGQELQHEAALTADATQLANNQNTNATQEDIDAARNQTQLGVAKMTARGQGISTMGRYKDVKDADGNTVGTEYVPGGIWTRDPDTNQWKYLSSEAPSQTVSGAGAAGTPSLPKGMKRQVGTSGGKPVYEDGSGKRFIGG